jgi:glycosyltransferase involved in cell wall biosynthesis
MSRVAILFDNFGPYHLARLKAASGVCDVLAVEFGSSSAEYDWKASQVGGVKRIALNDQGASRDLSTEEFQKRLFHVFDDYKPEVLVVPGWGYRGALMALRWGLLHRAPVICMSESTQWDEARNPIKEWIKRRIIGLFSAALVGGTPHRAYMQELGMPLDRIFLGYDAVDNGFFETEGAVTDAKQRLGQPRLKSKGGSGDLLNRKSPFLLASARFIEKKNLPRLLRAYAMYRGKAQEKAKFERLKAINETASGSIAPWDLILLGDGHLRPELEKLRSHLGLEDCVQMPGFKQYEELPAYYALAGAFIHASTTEQWGLVVNEAMASGLPVLVSNRCGCASDLLRESENGWTFDPTNEEQIADLMLRIASDEDARERMGARSSEIIAEWGPDRFASGLTGALQAAFSIPIKKIGLLDRLILWVMIRR